MPFSFRLVNFAHPLYLGADDEKEFNVWTKSIENAIGAIELRNESKTDPDIKTNLNIDYTVEIFNEKLDNTASDLASAKIYEIRIRAFWISWVIQKTYGEIYDLYSKVQRYMSIITYCQL